MLIDRILYPIGSLGPGRRVVIWTVGCNKRCPGCANPELRAFDPSKEMSVEAFSKTLKMLALRKIDGFSVTGGEPFCQTSELRIFLAEMKKYSDDILIFSGYTDKELRQMAETDPSVTAVRSMAAALILGEYRDELNDNKTALLASANQEILYEKEGFRAVYEDYMKQGRLLENVFYGENMISVGIHNTMTGGEG